MQTSITLSGRSPHIVLLIRFYIRVVVYLRKDGRRSASIVDCVDEIMKGLEEYTKRNPKKTNKLIREASNSNINNKKQTNLKIKIQSTIKKEELWKEK